ncbi:MobA/MobL family protein, partial [Acinetobacter baumannii]|uniref:MobA/MobL family protein n=1 Tax=Acinetobacter baumannii TaxID=470 RepID=UPI001C43783C
GGGDTGENGEKKAFDKEAKSRAVNGKACTELQSGVSPVGASPGLLDRQTFWNQVEQSELKKDGSIKQEERLAKEVAVALPHELEKAQRQACWRTRPDLSLSLWESGGRDCPRPPNSRRT